MHKVMRGERERKKRTWFWPPFDRPTIDQRLIPFSLPLYSLQKLFLPLHNTFMIFIPSSFQHNLSLAIGMISGMVVRENGSMWKVVNEREREREESLRKPVERKELRKGAVFLVITFFLLITSWWFFTNLIILFLHMECRERLKD